MTDLSSAARRSLDALKLRDALDPGAKARLRARIDASIAAGDEAPFEAPGAVTPEPGTLDARGIALRVALPVAIAAAVLLALWAIAPRRDVTRAERDGDGQAAYEAHPRPEGAASPSHARDRRPGATADGDADAPTTAADDASIPDPVGQTEPAGATSKGDATPARAPASSRTADHAAKRPSNEPGPSDTTLAEEMRLLKQARTALREGDANGALAVLKTHAETFARGQMVEDRDALRVEALCAADRSADARTAAAAFARAWPGSPHAARVQKICAVK